MVGVSNGSSTLWNGATQSHCCYPRQPNSMSLVILGNQFSFVCSHLQVHRIWRDTNGEGYNVLPWRSDQLYNVHGADDILSLGLTRQRALPENIADWAGVDRDTFEVSIRNIGDKFVGLQVWDQIAPQRKGPCILVDMTHKIHILNSASFKGQIPGV